MSRPQRILVAPLNWGLGHATRSIPIIRLLQEKGCEVVLASDGPALTLLKDEFPGLKAFELPGVDVRYGERFFALALARQMPALIRAIREERRVVAELVQTESIDAVISDNRFGSWGSGVPDVVLSHQWMVETGNPVTRPIATGLHRRILRRYSACWIPDSPGDASLAGKLSRAADPDVQHIGPLSRLSRQGRIPDQGSTQRLNVLVICSGPEPLRTRLEEVIVFQALPLPHSFRIARGLPDAEPVPAPASHIEMVNHLNADDMETALHEADVVVSRTGYTTLMDLAATGSKALLIPTPGQPEQEYLGTYHAGRGWWAIQSQRTLDLAAGLAHAMTLPGASARERKQSPLTTVLDRFLDGISPG